MFKLNYNFEHEVLKKIGLDPNLLHGVAGPEQWGLEEVPKDVWGSKE